MRVWEWLETIVLKSLGVRVVFEIFWKSSRVWVFERLCVCVFFKACGGAAMALNVLGKFKVMWVGKFLESSRVWVFKSAWKVRGCVGVESSRKVRGKCVESAWKVRRNGRGKCAESWRVWAWNVRGKLEGVGVG